jgi:chemotaxis signal transduction protein
MDPFFKGSQTAQTVLSYLHENGVETVEDYNVRPNPRYTDIDEAAAICISEKCDLVIVMGGGSAIDSAKAVALVATNGKSSWLYTTRENEYVEEAKNPPLPLIAIPTTAGTGAEATIYSVINNPEIHRKCAIRNLSMYPTLAIVDALLCVVGTQRFAVPQNAVREVLELRAADIRPLENAEIFPYRGGALPLVRLSAVMDLDAPPLDRLHVFVIGAGLQAVGLAVDRIVAQREVVVRAVSDPLLRIEGVAGATELGDGKPILILDPPALLRTAAARREERGDH